jgi:hypothetical protein
MVKQRMASADVAGEVSCLKQKILGLRLANIYDLSAKVPTYSSDRKLWKCMPAGQSAKWPGNWFSTSWAHYEHASASAAIAAAAFMQTYVLKLSKSGSDGEKVFLLLESGSRFHTVQASQQDQAAPQLIALGTMHAALITLIQGDCEHGQQPLHQMPQRHMHVVCTEATLSIAAGSSSHVVSNSMLGHASSHPGFCIS